MSITTAVLARDAAYTAELDAYLMSLRNMCANEEAYEAALEMAKDRAKESSLTMIEALQLTAREIVNNYPPN